MASTPCAACKLLRRKCTQECVFAPYFPPNQPQKFIYIHRAFGASNVTKILNDLPPVQREDAVASLYYEAEAHLRVPIYGCVAHISSLQHYLKKVQLDILNAKEELASYIENPSPYLPIIGNNRYPPPEFTVPYGVKSQEELVFKREPDLAYQRGMLNSTYGVDKNGSVVATGFSQMNVNGHSGGELLDGPSFGLGSFGDVYEMGLETKHHINYDDLQES
ncbi:unnamed protein product [Cochlearia groenlandica]